MRINTFKISRAMAKLKRKDHALFIAVQKKIEQIASYDEASIDDHFKNLRYDLSNLKAVHVGSFILAFRVVGGGTVIFESFRHHKEAYRR